MEIDPYEIRPGIGEWTQGSLVVLGRSTGRGCMLNNSALPREGVTPNLPWHVESIVLVVSAWEIGQGKQKRSGTVRDPLPEGPGPNRCGLQHRPQRCGRLTLKHRDEELRQPRLGGGTHGTLSSSHGGPPLLQAPHHTLKFSQFGYFPDSYGTR